MIPSKTTYIYCGTPHHWATFVKWALAEGYTWAYGTIEFRTDFDYILSRIEANHEHTENMVFWLGGDKFGVEYPPTIYPIKASIYPILRTKKLKRILWS